MKLPIIISVIFFIILGVIANVTVLKLTNMQFIGLMLISLVVLGVMGNFVGKANRKRKGIPGEPDAFIFPDKTAKKLKKMDLGIQYETSVISTALLLLGIVLFLIYFVFFQESSWIMKALVIFNSVCGAAMMFGMLVTYYQQLVSYRESTKFLTQFATSQSQPKQRPQQRPQQYQQPRQQPQQYYEEEPETLYDEEPLYEDEYYANDGYTQNHKNERRTHN
jgi:hypothetical protein